MSNGTDGDRHLIGGRYEIGELLGRGGMAEVRKGTDQRLGRVVAVKRLRTDLASDHTFQARFRREAQSAASLNHPAIVSVYDTGEELSTDGTDVPQPYIVMEYVAGRTLREILREGRKILPERALEITSGILSALDYSHRAGIVHRDIKPANVMLTPSGDVKVMDFGIARAIADSSSTMTQTAAVVGTAQYLSPEQARGETVDSRSDVYSTGCLLYELLTGRPPFVGESPVSVAYQHVREQADPPSTLDPDLPPEVDRIVMKALAKRTDERYQSAAEMRADIERFLAGKPVVAPPVAAAPTAFIPADAPTESTSIFHTRDDHEEDERKKRWPILLVALIVLALLIGAAVFGPMLFSSAPEENSVPSVLNMTRAQAKEAIEAAGLELGEVEKAPSTDVRSGLVLAQDPEPRSMLAPGSDVDITLSTGDPEVTIPNVFGLDKDEARQQLADLGLDVRLEEVQSDEPKDTVVATDPPRDTRVERGSTVVVEFSAGPQEVPSVVGLQESRARRVLERAGFVPEVTFDSETVAEKGTVLRQSPEAYTEQPQGTRVVITVSSYEEPEPTVEPTPTDEPTAEPSPSDSGTPLTGGG
ncbi:MAG TPA: Stk1 family PASTA domain-containing Ser/Thr kinase [Nocardioides sp.]|nr:Stk1 family PASTA domain-containing Ser/Thr kinase [Nocardioides sp.]